VERIASIFRVEKSASEEPAYFSTLKMEAIRSSETPVHFTGSTWRHIPEDGILHSHCCENLKSHMTFRDFRESNVSVKSVDFISALWGRSHPPKSGPETGYKQKN
jgi:hypothetical protein